MAEIGNVIVRVDAVITDEQYHEAMSAVSAANEYIAALEAENAKLRELLRDALPFVADESGFCTADCFVYPACCDYDGDEECPAVTRIHERARELGVEVSE